MSDHGNQDADAAGVSPTPEPSAAYVTTCGTPDHCRFIQRCARVPHAQAQRCDTVPPGVAIPSVTLPVEPTTELLQALVVAAELEQSDPEDHRYDDGMEAARAIYKALIAAAHGVNPCDGGQQA